MLNRSEFMKLRKENFIVEVDQPLTRVNEKYFTMNLVFESREEGTYLGELRIDFIRELLEDDKGEFWTITPSYTMLPFHSKDVASIESLMFVFNNWGEQIKVIVEDAIIEIYNLLGNE